MKKFALRLVGAGLLAVMLLTACGTGSSAAKDASTASQTPSAPDSPEAPKAATLSVSAAASLTDVMQALFDAYTAKTPGVALQGNYGASGALQAQIEEGAPVDLFFSAAQKPMNALEEKQLLEPNTRVDLLENKIVLIVPKDSRSAITSFADLEKAQTIALGEPESVPVGEYAKEILTSLGKWEAVQGKVTFGSDVRQVLSWVEAGEADCGVVYATDAATSDQIKVVCEAPEGSCKPVVYPAAVLKDSKQKEAAAQFLAFLSTDEAKAIFSKYGFTPL